MEPAHVAYFDCAVPHRVLDLAELAEGITDFALRVADIRVGPRAFAHPFQEFQYLIAGFLVGQAAHDADPTAWQSGEIGREWWIGHVFEDRGSWWPLQSALRCPVPANVDRALSS